ncbi:probable methyltransferase PMT5, partial [Tanacetum coccineum]
MEKSKSIRSQSQSKTKEPRDMQLLNMSKWGVLLLRQIKLGSTGDDLRFKTIVEECFNELKEHVIPGCIGLGSDVEFHQAGLTGSQVQISLERGLPAVIGNFNSRKLPFPSLSYDMGAIPPYRDEREDSQSYYQPLASC